MFVREKYTAYGENAAGREDWDCMVSTGFFGDDGEGLRRLEALGDDLSLTDTQLLELDDLLPA